MRLMGRNSRWNKAKRLPPLVVAKARIVAQPAQAAAKAPAHAEWIHAAQQKPLAAILIVAASPALLAAHRVFQVVMLLPSVMATRGVQNRRAVCKLLAASKQDTRSQ